MGVERDIQTALDTRLQTSGLGVPIAFGNTKYTPTHNTPYIRPTLLPANTTTFMLDSTYRHSGIYQIDVFVPADTGMAQLYTLMDAVTAAYKSNLYLAANIFVQSIGRGRSERQDAWFTSYIQIDYLCYSL